MYLVTTCTHCAETVARPKSGHAWRNQAGQAECATSPIGKHQWNGTDREVRDLADAFQTEA